MTLLSYHDYSVSGSSNQQCSDIPLNLLCFLSSILVHHKNFFVKYLISIDLFYDFQKQDTSQNFHMAWHAILCSIGYIDVPNNGIEQACSLASCDIHISRVQTIAGKKINHRR